jgi:hypothetical protein
MKQLTFAVILKQDNVPFFGKQNRQVFGRVEKQSTMQLTGLISTIDKT